jgi:hypothetical protein
VERAGGRRKKGKRAKGEKNVDRRRWKLRCLLLAAGIAGGMLAAGCSSGDVRQETIATVNGEPVQVGELRESLGVPAGAFAVPEIPGERKKEALDRLVAARLLAQEGRSLGLDRTPEFKETLDGNERRILIKALVREEIGEKLKVTDEEMKAVIAKVRKSKPGISDAEAAARAVEWVSSSRVRKIREELLAAAMKETAADPKAVPGAGKEEAASDDVEPSDRDLTMRALAAYAKKRGIDGSKGHNAMRQEMERSVLRAMVADNVVGKNVAVTGREIETEFARRTEWFTKRGRKLPAEMAAQLKELSRVSLLQERRKAAVDAYLDALRRKAKITIRADILSKV